MRRFHLFTIIYLLLFSFLLFIVGISDAQAAVEPIPGDSCAGYPAGAVMHSGGPELGGAFYIMSCTSGLWTADPCVRFPLPGDTCSDGSYYIGQVGGNKIYATTAASESSKTWNDGSTNYTTTGVTSATNGPGNTATLVGDTGNADYPYQAAEYCDGLSAHGHSDWYLPAKDELNLFWHGGSPVAGVDTSPGSEYWSSTEYVNTTAWYQRFSNGVQGSGVGKYYSLLVRCVRRR